MALSSNTVRWVAAGSFTFLVSACADPSDSILSPAVELAAVTDSTGSPLSGAAAMLAVSALDAGIVLTQRAVLTVEVVERNAAWWHSLSVVSPENRLLAGPGYLFPRSFPPVGPYGPGSVTFRLDSYNPREPHEFFGTATAQISGSFPSWTINFEDGGGTDFDDIIMKVTAQAVECTMFDEEVDDLLLLDPVVQRILSQLADLSNFDKPFANRLERGGYIVQQPDGSIEFLEHRYFTPDGTPGGQPELCVAPFDPLYQAEISASGGKILGQIHTHPVQQGIQANPGTCNRWTPRRNGTFDVQPIPGPQLDFDPGPSRRDLRDWERGAAEWPGYMMSPDRVYRWERKGPFGQTGLANRDDFKLKKEAGGCIPQ